MLNYYTSPDNSKDFFKYFTLISNALGTFEIYIFKKIKINIVGPHGIVGRVPVFQPGAAAPVRFPMGSEILISILGMGVSLLCFVQCSLWR